MNKKQIIISIIGIGIIFIMGLIPPWKTIDHGASAFVEFPIGYYPIFSPPILDEELELSVKLDILRLAVQWITILFVMGAALFICQTKSSETDADAKEDFLEE